MSTNRYAHLVALFCASISICIVSSSAQATIIEWSAGQFPAPTSPILPHTWNITDPPFAPIVFDLTVPNPPTVPHHPYQGSDVSGVVVYMKFYTSSNVLIADFDSAQLSITDGTGLDLGRAVFYVRPDCQVSCLPAAASFALPEHEFDVSPLSSLEVTLSDVVFTQFATQFTVYDANVIVYGRHYYAPEPATLPLLGIGLIVFAFSRRKSRRRSLEFS